MIYDLIENKDLYLGLGEKYKKAFDFILKASVELPAPGKYVIDGDDVYANVSEYDTKTGEVVYEAHKDYVDIQYLISGHENIYWKNIKDCTVTTDYNDEKDCALLTAENPVVLDMQRGNFAILFPDDVHAPCRTAGEVSHVHKIVVKVKVD
ncbi:MAG: YhcH/YjgK/YiaL family protein [Clostridia bacterium]|nr:YhcH/YjgK/YiaL family protein [Clostridia bacterium]